MEPLRPQDRDLALESGASEDDIAEYNRLVAERFTTNPYVQMSPADIQRVDEREQQIGDLYQKLFSVVSPST